MLYYLFKGYHWMGNYTVLHWFIGQVVVFVEEFKKMRMPAKWHLFTFHICDYIHCLINIRTIGMIRKVWYNDTGKIKVVFMSECLNGLFSTKTAYDFSSAAMKISRTRK